MPGSSAKSIAKQIGLLGVLTVFVTVLTFLFNLVGTLCICIGGGMMAGASRRFNWQIVSMSLLPPVVALALGRLSNVSFDNHQWFSVVGISLGSFWGTWLATYLLMFLEKKGTPADTDQAVAAVLDSLRQPSLNLAAAGLDGGSTEACLKLDDLQGTWLCETARPRDPSKKRMFVVEQSKFSLSVVNSNGHSHLVAQGELAVQDTDGKKNLLLSSPPEHESENYWRI